jgi:hypothetical protein
MNDTNNTESADDQVDVGKAVSDQLSCSVAVMFYGLGALSISLLIITFFA